jgi:hypothetical protein
MISTTRKLGDLILYSFNTEIFHASFLSMFTFIMDFHPDQTRNQWQALVKTVMNLLVP